MNVFIILLWTCVVSGDHFTAPDGSLVFFPSPEENRLSGPIFVSPPQGPLPSGQSLPQPSQDFRRFERPFVPYNALQVPQAAQPSLQPFPGVEIQPQIPFVSQPQPQLAFVPQTQPQPSFESLPQPPSQPQLSFVSRPSSPQLPQPQLPFVPQPLPRPSFVSQPQPLPQPQPSFVSQPQPLQPQLSFVSQPSSPQLTQPQLPFIYQPLPQAQPALVSQPSRPQPPPQNPSCGGSGGIIHETRAGKNYHFSWCVNTNTYSWDQANSYCSRLGRGFQLVSIQDKDKDDFITSVIARNPIQFIWTSGNKRGTTTWRWSSGYTLSYTNWSHTGGLGRPQPDNREGNEDCLGVLKNIYNDGIKWHDIACHHVKAVICETSL
ncbi:tyrosine-protein phosphatase non-receptor type 23-like [Procambarus clarkii]|uniref:tyrosine-protein phosphatase non-receptor type 23-like n=1 Tax=Procambarus clarkii TaxID=6728 RepID=UPI001E6779DD|nr:tyrosine-protein phosphatase non-receptor type 23-like [Procambarus clarkii]